MQKIIITIDGPAGAGKGTLAKALSHHFQLCLLETGLLYRALAFLALQNNTNVENEKDLCRLCKNIDLSKIKTDSLKQEPIARLSSQVAVIPSVRSTLLEYQRNFAYHPPSWAQGTILDGRDIGTFVLPDAPIKLYIEADASVRAKRRMLEYAEKGISIEYNAVLEDIQQRDHRDCTRPTSPLYPAQDAFIIDTSSLTRHEVQRQAIHLVQKKLHTLGKD